MKNIMSATLLKLTGITFLILCMNIGAWTQSLYTARGYWQESTKPSYLTIKEKKEKRQSVSADEEAYSQDYDAYLLSYYNRLSESEKELYLRMKDEWDRELALPLVAPQPAPQQNLQIEQSDFEWRGRDRVINAAYGIYYGTSLSVITGLENAAAAGIPLITGGLWMLGPAFNSKKYEGITESTMRAANTGKILGLMYGASLGLALAGDNDNTGKVVLGLSTIGSITLGEVAFQTQKKKNISDGKIELMRHYGFLGILVGVSALGATNTENVHLIGAGLLTGGVGGLLVGNKVAGKYAYTRGDVDALSPLTVISTGLGAALIANAFESNSEISSAIWLVPASMAVAGTLLGQRMVRDVHLTKRQGSAINLSSTGGALLGVGVMLMAGADSPTAWLAVPSVTALVAHQLVFSRYKRENLLNNFKGDNSRKKKYDFSMKLMPENYLVNKHMPLRLNADPRIAPVNPLVNIALRMK